MESMQSVISIFFGILFPHTIEVDQASDLAYLMLYEPYSARYSVKVIVKSQIIADALRRYNEEWTIESMKDFKKPLVIVTAGVMEQQPIQSTFLGRAVEEKFHLSATTISLVPCISLVSEKLKGMVHPDIVPTKLSPGEKEGYYVVNLCMKQNFDVGPEYHNMSDYRQDYTGTNEDNITDVDDDESIHDDDEELPDKAPFKRARNIDITRSRNAEEKEEIIMGESEILRANNFGFSDFEESDLDQGDTEYTVANNTGIHQKASNETASSNQKSKTATTTITDVDETYEMTESDYEREAILESLDKPSPNVEAVGTTYEMTESDYEREAVIKSFYSPSTTYHSDNEASLVEDRRKILLLSDEDSDSDDTNNENETEVVNPKRLPPIGNLTGGINSRDKSSEQIGSIHLNINTKEEGASEKRTDQSAVRKKVSYENESAKKRKRFHSAGSISSSTSSPPASPSSLSSALPFNNCLDAEMLGTSFKAEGAPLRKRTRGRPRKLRTNNETDESSVPRRSRGRPRKQLEKPEPPKQTLHSFF